tara:strand:+ start:18990 stop:20084 length:1095 start_codon:yes stop_codon:yes gene_type:complete
VGAVNSKARAVKLDNGKYDEKFVILDADLQSCQFESRDLKHLIDLPALETITIALSEHVIDDEAIKWIGQCESLRALRLYYCKLKTSQLAKMPGLKKLQFLHISEKQLDDQWAFLAEYPNLNAIAFSGTVPPDLSGLGQFPQVRSLYLYDVKSMDAKLVQQLQKKNPGIRVLINNSREVVGANPVFPIARTLAEAGWVLSGKQIGRNKSGVWDGTSHWQFKEIEIEKPKNLTTEMWESVPDLSGKYSKIEVSGLQNADELLPRLKSPFSVNYFSLARSDLTDRGLLEFARQMNADIRILDVRWTKVTKPALELFRKMHPTVAFSAGGGNQKDFPFLGMIQDAATVSDYVKIPLLIPPEDIGKSN